jgi:hypothetical protein
MQMDLHGQWPVIFVSLIGLTAGLGGVAIALLVLRAAPRLSGWNALAERSPAKSSGSGLTFRWQSGKIGYFGINGCLTVGVLDDGLKLDVSFPTIWDFKSILIPWTEISQVERESGWFASSAKLTAADTRLMVMGAAADELWARWKKTR